MPEVTADLARRAVTVIATPGTPPSAVRAGMEVTATIPIVFGVGDDPVKWGIVAGFGRPNHNATGINFSVSEIVGKRLELLRELVPGAARIAVLLNSADPARSESTLNDVQAAARTLLLQIQVLYASTSRQIEAAFATLARERPDALLVGPDGFFNGRRVQLATLAARHAIPTTFAVREYADAGGLMSYGASLADMHRQVGIYVGRILKGEKPADLPVIRPAKFELVINGGRPRRPRPQHPVRLRKRRGSRLARVRGTAARGSRYGCPIKREKRDEPERLHHPSRQRGGYLAARGARAAAGGAGGRLSRCFVRDGVDGFP
jgi:putative ABC transport system substrate-binding protein